MIDNRIDLRQVPDAIREISDYTNEERDRCLADARTQDAVIRNLEIIGEAVKSLGEVFRAAHPSTSWKRIAGLRDILVHRDFRVEIELVWEVVDRRLPMLAVEAAH